MSWSLYEIEKQIASEVDQSDTPPVEGTSDWNTRLSAINRSLIDWANSNDWDALKVVHNGIISTSTGNASFVLPGNFSKIESYPRIMSDGHTAYEFPVVNPSKNTIYNDNDKFVNILGNDGDTKTMYIHADALVSGASVQFVYWKSPQSLASASQVTEIPDPTFLVQRALYYIYKGAEDGRFPEAKVESEKILARMIENENSLGLAYVDRNIPNQLGQRHFVIGIN
jgi:hypothetical protein